MSTEPPGLSRDDSRKPDGTKVFAYKHKKPLRQDCICVYNFASVHVNESAMRAGSDINAARTT